MPVIFISYRRSDSQDVTGRIYDRLTAKYSRRQVFKDVDNIPLGVSFPMHIQQMLGKANLALVIIGPNWATATDEQGRRRLDDPNDFVRVEVEAALHAKLPVVPVLVSNARMPLGAELPPSLRKLVARNGMAVRPDPDFNNDMDRLFSGIKRLAMLRNTYPYNGGREKQAEAPSTTPWEEEEVNEEEGLSLILGKTKPKHLLLLLIGLSVILVGWQLVYKFSAKNGETTAQIITNNPSKNEKDFKGNAREITNSIGMKLVYIPPGRFIMGSPITEQRRLEGENEHEVEITKGFYMGEFEVTQQEYENIVGTNPSRFSIRGAGKEYVHGQDTRRFPVENVSWNDAVSYCGRLSIKENKTYRLPSEAEWEYACRAGSRTPFNFGAADNGRMMNACGDLPYGMEEKGPYIGDTCAVGNYPPNAFGLHDMHGNVWEWCEDWYAQNYYANSPRQNPQGPQNGTHRVLRGGAFIFETMVCRSAFRNHDTSWTRNGSYGFRVVLVGSFPGPP